MASLAVAMCYSGRDYYECECEVVLMSNGRYAYKAVCDTGGHVFKFTTRSNYEMYRYNLTQPPDEVETFQVVSERDATDD